MPRTALTWSLGLFAAGLFAMPGVALGAAPGMATPVRADDGDVYSLDQPAPPAPDLPEIQVGDQVLREARDAMGRLQQTATQSSPPAAASKPAPGRSWWHRLDGAPDRWGWSAVALFVALVTLTVRDARRPLAAKAGRESTSQVDASAPGLDVDHANLNDPNG